VIGPGVAYLTPRRARARLPKDPPSGTFSSARSGTFTTATDNGTFNSSRDALPYLGPTIEFAAEDHPVVFDLEPLRSVLTQRDDKTRDLQQLEDVALRYDALVLFPRYHRATCSVTTWLC